MTRTRILLADDHKMICDGFRRLLEPEYEVVGSVVDGRSALTAAAELKPDIVLMDVGMPILNGLDAGRELKKTMPGTKIIILTTNTDVDIAIEAMRIGAAGYVLKSSESAELLQAVRDVQAGKSYVTQRISRAMEEKFIRDPRLLHQPQHLTDREREVLQLLAEGRSMKEIADALQITVRTVRFHKSRIMEELGVSSTAELVQYAIKRSMISLPSE